MAIRIFICGLALAAGLAGRQESRDLKSLYDNHQWFRLRDAVRATTAPALYRGAVASAFNDSGEAEKELKRVIAAVPASEQAAEARGLLIYVYQRSGRYRQALSQIETLLAAEPGNASLKNAQSFFRGLSRYPEQAVSARRPSPIRYSIKDGNLFVPLLMNGESARYIVDTGANFSTVGESEARRLHMRIDENSAKGTDATGGALGLRTAVADRLTVGGFQFRHAVFLVARDDQQPFVDLPVGERGVIGLPILLALENLRWSADGTFEAGFHSADRNAPAPNICFDGADIVTEAGFQGARLNLQLDTGATGTLLYPKFSEEFTTLVNASGKRESKRVRGVGNTVEIESAVLPETILRIGGLDVALRPAYALLKQVGSPWYHGRLGLDLLRQARVVTIDLHTMTLQLGN